MSFPVLRLLILSDVDIESAISLAEHFVPTSPPPFDVIVVCGPLSHHHQQPSSSSSSSAESAAMATGDMASVIAHLENIVCRVLYVPGDQDPLPPPSSSSEQQHLTPNSVNLHATSLPLADDLYISGFMEKEALHLPPPAPASTSTSTQDEENRQEEEEGMQLQCSSSSTAVEEVLRHSAACCFPPSRTTATTTVVADSHIDTDTDTDTDTVPPQPLPPCGIFVFNYKFAHSLNNFLFFQPPEVARLARLRLLVIPSFADSSSSSSSGGDSSSSGGDSSSSGGGSNFEFPRVLNNYTIAAPRSLRLEGAYTTVQLTHHSCSPDSSSRGSGSGKEGQQQGDAWMVSHIQDHVLLCTPPPACSR